MAVYAANKRLFLQGWYSIFSVMDKFSLSIILCSINSRNVYMKYNLNVAQILYMIDTRRFPPSCFQVYIA